MDEIKGYFLTFRKAEVLVCLGSLLVIYLGNVAVSIFLSCVPCPSHTRVQLGRM